MSRHLRIAALAAVGLVAACGDGGGTGSGREGQARDVGAAAGLPGEVQDLLAEAAGVVDQTYRVVYEAPAAGGEPVRVVVTQRPPDRRIDVTSEAGDVESTILLDGTTYQCRTAPGPASCTELAQPPVAVGLFDPAVVAEVTESLTASADLYDFRVEDRDVLGLPARCLVTELRGDAPTDPALGRSGLLCLSPEGVILRAETPTGTLAAVAYEVEVTEDAFLLPAGPERPLPGGGQTRPTVPPD